MSVGVLDSNLTPEDLSLGVSDSNLTTELLSLGVSGLNLTPQILSLGVSVSNLTPGRKKERKGVDKTTNVERNKGGKIEQRINTQQKNNSSHKTKPWRGHVNKHDRNKEITKTSWRGHGTQNEKLLKTIQKHI